MDLLMDFLANTGFALADYRNFIMLVIGCIFIYLGIAKHYEPRMAVRRYKRFAYYFASNFRYGHTLFSQVLNAGDMPQITQIINRFFDQSPDLVSRPNSNFFI